MKPSEHAHGLHELNFASAVHELRHLRVGTVDWRLRSPYCIQVTAGPQHGGRLAYRAVTAFVKGLLRPKLDSAIQNFCSHGPVIPLAPPLTSSSSSSANSSDALS